jgi:hypothetical protein
MAFLLMDILIHRKVMILVDVPTTSWHKAEERADGIYPQQSNVFTQLNKNVQWETTCHS